jgi:hypothetical protein
MKPKVTSLADQSEIRIKPKDTHIATFSFGTAAVTNLSSDHALVIRQDRAGEVRIRQAD